MTINDDDDDDDVLTIRGPRVADILHQVISIHNENTKGTNPAQKRFREKKPLRHTAMSAR